VKKLIAILVIILLSFAFLGYHLVFSFQIASVKSQMKDFLQKQEQHKDIVLLSLSKEESKQLSWENENEFRYKGEMFDVIKKKANGNLVLIRCIPDKKETYLLNEYQKNNRRNTSNSTIVQLITAQFILPADHSLKPAEKLITNYFKDYCSRLQSLASTVLLPPPDVC
jgi:hypothetical protein